MISSLIPKFGTQAKDCLYWKDHPSGKFTIKTGYAHLAGLKSETQGEGSKFLKIIWRIHIMPKWKIFLWNLYHNALKVKDNLASRGINISTECDYCGIAGEDMQHLFGFVA